MSVSHVVGSVSDAPPKKGQETKKWYCPGGKENKHLPALLRLASENYARQTDWFLKHRDTGIRNIGTILAAEFTIIGLTFTPNLGIPDWFVIVLLIIMGILAALLGHLSILSCRRSYKTSLEYALVELKIIWALGLQSNVAVTNDSCGKGYPQYDTDEYLFVKRFVENAYEFTATSQQIDNTLKERDNTFYWGIMTIRCFCFTAVTVSLAAIIGLLMMK